jgi:tetratricopeptide (TPR) repeat protein
MTMRRGAVTAVLCLLMMGPSISVYAKEDALAMVMDVKNQAEVERSEDGGWVAAEVGMDIRLGDRLRTGDDSRVVLLLANGTTMNIHENSAVSFSEDMGGGSASSPGFGTFLHGMWQAIADKFIDTEYADVASGRIGAIRGTPEDEEVLDALLTGDDKTELQRQVDILNQQMGDEGSRMLLMGILYEKYEQYASAEAAYKRAIEISPKEEILYDMLVDLYLEAGALARMKEVREKKEALFGG